MENKGGSKTTIGCGDRITPITVSVDKDGKKPAELVELALGYLLMEKDMYVGKGGLYNALYQSDLKVDKVDVKDKAASVYLTGSIKLGGTCDSPRFEEQIKQTVIAIDDVDSVTIYLNGKTLDLSQK